MQNLSHFAQDILLLGKKLTVMLTISRSCPLVVPYTSDIEFVFERQDEFHCLLDLPAIFSILSSACLRTCSACNMGAKPESDISTALVIGGLVPTSFLHLTRGLPTFFFPAAIVSCKFTGNRYSSGTDTSSSILWKKIGCRHLLHAKARRQVHALTFGQNARPVHQCET